MVNEVGIIGFGQMGRILADIFSARFNVAVFDINLPKNIKISSLAHTASSDLVIFCVPFENLSAALKDARSFICSDSVVMDITSVKEKPVEIIKKLLPAKVSILGTHPMFGPNSLKISEEKNIVFCPIRISDQKLHEIEDIFKTLGFKVFKMTPKKHDQLMTRSHLLVHLFGQITNNLKIREFSFAPESFKLMLKAFRMADPNDQFLRTMILENKFAKGVLRALQKDITKYLSKS